MNFVQPLLTINIVSLYLATHRPFWPRVVVTCSTFSLSELGTSKPIDTDCPILGLEMPAEDGAESE